MGGCAAIGCLNHSRKKNRMFRFPKEADRRRKWIENCGLNPHSLAKVPYLCIAHFDEDQFEQNRQDGWKKLKANAVPTLFFPPATPEKRGPKPRIKSIVASSKSKPKLVKSLKIKVIKEKSKPSRRDPLYICQTSNKTEESSNRNQKENSAPRLRKSTRPCKVIIPPEYALSSSTEFDDGESSDEWQKPIKPKEEKFKIKKFVKVRKERKVKREKQVKKEPSIFKKELDALLNEIAKCEKSNRSMVKVIFELEKHNNHLANKVVELEKENKVLNYKAGDLENLNNDLKKKLRTSFSEDQLSRMEKMKALGTIERYIPGISD